MSRLRVVPNVRSTGRLLDRDPVTGKDTFIYVPADRQDLRATFARLRAAPPLLPLKKTP